jgi:hypothetical protein
MSVWEVQTTVHPSSSPVQSGATTVTVVQKNLASPRIPLHLGIILYICDQGVTNILFWNITLFLQKKEQSSFPVEVTVTYY